MPTQTTQVGMERKLAAILSADVAGYSRLMGEDEEATIRILTVYHTVTDSLIQQHRGRIVGTAGDSILAEFASAWMPCSARSRSSSSSKPRTPTFRPSVGWSFALGSMLGT